MMFAKLPRLARMDRAEVAWRSAGALRCASDRIRVAFVPPRWERSDLGPRLAPLPSLANVRAALAERQWPAAEAGLAGYIINEPQRFVVSQTLRAQLVDRIRRQFPESADSAAEQGDRIVSGEYDLLGYRALRFDNARPAPVPCAVPPSACAALNWHYDPVHDRHAPRQFWAAVPYLDPKCGDHKIIWELNRHQHWLALGRAYWLTGDLRYRDRFLFELESWLEQNPPLVGINWASGLELAFRSLSWIWAVHFFGVGLVDLLLGLDRQLGHIERNLSYYFSPNTHLTGEALALYVSGRTLPLFEASERRAALGRDVLVGEIRRQIAPDGGHCERSTHYHKYTLDFYLLALAIARLTHDPVAPEFERAAEKLALAARLLADDNGIVPRIGDDDAGALAPFTRRPTDDLKDSLSVAAVLLARGDLRPRSAPEDAWWLLAGSPLASDLDILETPSAGRRPASAALPDTGYYVSRSAAGDHLVIDGGPHGFLNGGHAHADALAITFARRDVPLFIDPGTGCYTIQPAIRDRFRSTPMHNTLVIDSRSQSIPDGPFQWGRTAATTVTRWQTSNRFDYFDGWHDGYQPICHRRRVLTVHDDLLIVADLVDGPGEHHATVHWLVDPRWHVEVCGRHALFFERDLRVELYVAAGAMDALQADYSPLYGRIEPTTAIRFTRATKGPTWMVSVIGLDGGNTIVSVDTVPVWAQAGVLGQATAVRIARTDSIDYFLAAEPAPAAGPTAAWRVGDLETDARALLGRFGARGDFRCLAAVGASVIRVAGRDLGRDLLDGASSAAGPADPPYRRNTCAELPAS